MGMAIPMDFREKIVLGKTGLLIDSGYHQVLVLQQKPLKKHLIEAVIISPGGHLSKVDHLK